MSGLRVVELGHFVAAPFAARILADLGAEIIKIEPPGQGDPARGWGAAVDGHSLWWSIHARNKKCVTLNLKLAAGREVLLDLVAKSDAVIENFRPGQLEAWGLGPEALQNAKPGCVLVRISGYGQTGPYRDRTSFGVIGEAMGGLRYLTGYPPEMSDLPPVRAGISLGDSVAGLYAVIGLLASVWRRDVRRAPGSQDVDVALYEAVFSLLEGSLTEYGRLGIVRQPSGSRIPTAAPTNAYRCKDGVWIVIAGNSDRIFQRLMNLVGRDDLAADPLLQTNAGRLAQVNRLDDAIGAWAGRNEARAAVDALNVAEVPASLMFTIADCVEDPHYRERGMIEPIEDPLFGRLLHPGVVPRFGDHGVSPVRWPGPPLGSHNDEVYRRLLGYDSERLKRLAAEGIV